MNKDTKKIVEHLQNTVEGLKELSEGCKGTIAGVPIKITAYKNQVYWYIRTNTLVHEGLRKSVFEESFQIIGHEPTLNHLLLAIENAGNEQDIEDLYMEVLNRYDLSKDLVANLDSNEELRNYLLQTFNLN